MFRLPLVIGIGFLTLLCGPLALAQSASFPNKSVRIIVPFPPGGASDITARVLAEKLGAMWKQPVVVDNRPGASGVIGTDLVAKSPPDGYTLGLVPSGHATNAVTFSKLPYDTAKDFTYVTITASVPLVVVAASSFPAKNLQELVAMAKKEPGKLSYASSGAGGISHLAGELFNSMTGADLLHVPYKGSTAAQPDVISGRVTLMFDSAVSVTPQIKAGTLKAYAVTSKSRSSVLPDLPSVSETVAPGYEATSWGGIIGPAGIPPDVVRKLNADIVTVLRMPDVKERLAGLGADVVASSPEEFAQLMRVEMDKWGKIVKAANIKMD
jgi:tripartite-type tricarboxylate transporter receptor subunit TctC